MFDKIEKLDSSLIQHGKLGDRIYLMHLAEKDAPTLPEKLVLLAQENKYTKIFAKVPPHAMQYFQKYYSNKLYQQKNSYLPLYDEM